MKQRILLLIIVCSIFACKKNDDGSSNSGNTPPVGNPPSSFTKKVLIESFTGEWNPNCPTGQDSAVAMANLLPDRIYAAAIHQGDWLSTGSIYTDISTHLGGVSGFPRAAINRAPATKGNQLDSVVYSIYNWRSNLLELTQASTTNVGLALMSKERNNYVDLSVFIGYTDSIKKRTRLSIYLIEDSVKAVSQANADTNYHHQFVLRKILTSNLGDSVQLFDKKTVTLNYSQNIKGFYSKKENLKIIAFIHVIGDDWKHHEILNVQSVGLNNTKKWD